MPLWSDTDLLQEEADVAEQRRRKPPMVIGAKEESRRRRSVQKNEATIATVGDWCRRTKPPSMIGAEKYGDCHEAVAIDRRHLPPR